MTLMNLEQTIDNIPPGRYVIAVSGGVDSMVLLDLLSRRSDIQLVVAHLDHGIRNDSHLEGELILEFTKDKDIDVEIGRASLGQEASEEVARQVRYEFLHDIMNEYDAQAIITAHHRDDVLETAIIYLLRGSGWRGLVSLKSRPRIVRPLIDIHKSQLETHAQKHNIPWREDPTNSDQKYLRNYVRHSIIPKMSDQTRQQLLRAIDDQKKAEALFESTIFGLQEHVFNDQSGIMRSRFVQLPHDAAREIMHNILRNLEGVSVDRPTIERLVHFTKTARPQARYQLSKDWDFVSDKNHVRPLRNTNF